jgi:hypothetical protein
MTVPVPARAPTVRVEQSAAAASAKSVSARFVDEIDGAPFERRLLIDILGVIANTPPLASGAGTSVARGGLGLRVGRAEGGGDTDASGRTAAVCGGELGHWPVQAASIFAPRLIRAG